MSVSPVGFFLSVSPHPGWVWAGFSGIVLFQAWTLWQAPGDAGGMLAATLLLQMFSVSTGFSTPASRGHYDPVLTAGRARIVVGLAHLAASAAPGAVAWGLLAGLEALLGPSGWPLALSARGLLALATVSTVAWALTLRLPRLSGGALWTALLVGGALSREGFSALAAVVAEPPAASSVGGVLREGVIRAAVPFLLLSERRPPHEATVLAVVLAVALLTLVVALAFISRRDYPLAED